MYVSIHVFIDFCLLYASQDLDVFVRTILWGSFAENRGDSWRRSFQNCETPNSRNSSGKLRNAKFVCAIRVEVLRRIAEIRGDGHFKTGNGLWNIVEYCGDSWNIVEIRNWTTCGILWRFVETVISKVRNGPKISRRSAETANPHKHRAERCRKMKARDIS